jgi:hypothetical protein
VNFEYNPYADIWKGEDEDVINDNYNMGANAGELKYQQDELSEYKLPKHQNQIEYFKIL